MKSMNEKNCITWFEKDEKTKEQFDSLTLLRFNIKNTNPNDLIKLDNYYSFNIMDRDEDSKTGNYTMCINKEFAKLVKENLEKWKNSQKK